MTLVNGHHELRHVAMVFGLPLDCCATPSVPTWQSGVVDGEPGLQLAPSQGQYVTDPPHPRASDSGGITVTITRTVFEYDVQVGQRHVPGCDQGSKMKRVKSGFPIHKGI